MDASWIIVVKDQGKNCKDYAFYIAACDVLSLYGAGMLKEVAAELEKYRIDNAAIKEIRWRVKCSFGYGEFHTDIQW